MLPFLHFKASRSQRDKLKERPDETRHVVEHKTGPGGEDAADGDQRRNQESLGHVRAKRSRGRLPPSSHHGPGGDGDVRRKKAASFDRVEESLPPPKPNTSLLSKQPQDTWRKTETRKQWSSREDGETKNCTNAVQAGCAMHRSQSV